jgi:cytochrome c-type protein NapB
MSATNETGRLGGRRLALIAVLAALTVGISGFFMGIRQTQQSTQNARSEWMATPAPDDGLETRPEAPHYRDIPTSLVHANRRQKPHLEALPRLADNARFLPETLTETDRLRLARSRSSRRQYDGAPPLAPHPIDQRSPAACLECHGKPTRIGAVDVPQMSHVRHTNCLQCHVSSVGPASGWIAQHEALSDGNSFVGQGPSGKGDRAFTGAPPVIPHTTWMRENCSTCHGLGGTVAMRTPHPERQSCTQCHAPNAALDQRLAAGLPPPLPLALWQTGPGATANEPDPRAR